MIYRPAALDKSSDEAVPTLNVGQHINYDVSRPFEPRPAHAEQLRRQSFESIALDNRIWVGIDQNDDPIAARQIIDPVAVDHFAGSDTVWEVTRAGVTAYRRGRTTRAAQIDALVADAEFLASRVEAVARRSQPAA